jgi:hypothetical protein
MPPSSKRKNPPLCVGLKTLSDYMGVSAVTLRKLARDKIIPQEPSGLYDLGKCIRAWIDWRLSSGTSPKRRIEEERARQLKRQNDVAAGKLMPTEDWHFMSLEVVAIFNLHVEALPPRSAPLCVGKSAAEIVEILRVECERCRTNIRGAFKAKESEIKSLIDTEE